MQADREIGIRAALGAPRAGLLGMVVRQGKMLFGINARDPRTFGGVVLVLLAVAFGACVAPALRATRVSPLEALKGE